MMKCLNVLFAVTLIGINIVLSQAQERICIADTTFTARVSNREINNYFRLNNNFRNAADLSYIPIQIHIITNSEGAQADEAEILKSIKSMNDLFKNINIQFTFCGGINYALNDELFDLESEEEKLTLLSLYNKPNTIDIFYVGSISNQSVCGYSSIGWELDGFIIIQSSCINNKTIEHEMGHYFNLFHTHETAFGIELADSSNCVDAGDLVCDTPADPNLLNKVGTDCHYYAGEKDPKGFNYSPSVNNIMSYSLADCKNSFTTLQYKRMLYYYENYIRKTARCLDVERVDFSVSATMDSSRILPGSSVPVKVSIRNNSMVTYEGPLSYKIFIENPTGNLIDVDSNTVIRSFPSRSIDTSNILIHIPDTLKSSAYTFAILIDSKKTIEESNENNNVYRTKIKITPVTTSTIPDLQVKISLDSNFNICSNPKLNIKIINSGQAKASSTNVYIYVSKDSIISTDDIKFGPYFVESLSQQQSSDFIFYIPKQKKKDYSFSVISFVDPDNKIIEGHKDNNCSIVNSQNLKYSSSLPDYYFENSNLSPFGLTSTIGNETKVTYKVINGGKSCPDTISLEIYLSKDSVVNTKEKLLYFKNFIMADTFNVNANFTITEEIEPGRYFLIAKINEANLFCEENEYNNSFINSIIIEGPYNPTGLVILETEILMNDLLYQSNMQLKLKIKNKGLSTSKKYKIIFFLSKDKEKLEPPYSSLSEPIFINELKDQFIENGENIVLTVKDRLLRKVNPGTYVATTCIAEEGNKENSGYTITNCKEHHVPIIIGDITDVLYNYYQLNKISCFETLTISSQIENLDYEVCIYHVNGQVVIQKLSNDKIQIGTLLPGIYIVKIFTSNGAEFKKLLID